MLRNVHDGFMIKAELARIVTTAISFVVVIVDFEFLGLIKASLGSHKRYL